MTFQNNGINKLIASLQKVSAAYKATNGQTVTAICPCHDDHSPSLFITEKNDGTPLIFCHGCGANGVDVAEAVGMNWTEVSGHGLGKTHRKPQKTGHAHSALVARASSLIRDAFLTLSATNVADSEERLAMARCAGALNGIAEELRRADR